MVSAEKGLPDSFDPKTGRNVRWSARLGTRGFASPVIAGGKVFLGTNNEHPRDEKHQGDRGVLMCFEEASGRFLWQLVAPKLEEDMFHDWPQAGMCSPPTVEGGRVYMATNRDEIVCLDIDAMANGNDGPVTDEGRRMSPADQPPLTPGPTDADILWATDLRKTVGVRPHDSVHASPLIDGPFLYVNTNNGLNSKHTGVEKPNAPSLVVLDKQTGQLLAQDEEAIGPRVFHSTWSPPALVEVDGQRQVVFAGGDGVVYGFAALLHEDRDRLCGAAEPQRLELLWKFDCDPTAPKENVHQYIRNRRESPSNIKSTPVIHNGRVYVTAGGDIWWGKRQSWLTCFRPGGTGDITRSNLAWSFEMKTHCCSTPSVAGGLVYVADCRGNVHCLDANTGELQWTHDAGGEMWSSTLVADGKIYIGTRRGVFWILSAGKEKRVLCSVELDDPIISTCAAANGAVYFATYARLYALAR